MRITESQLRRIIRQEARRLTEMPARRPAAGRGRVKPAGGMVSYEGPEFTLDGAMEGATSQLGDGTAEANAAAFDELADFCMTQVRPGRRSRVEVNPVRFISINAIDPVEGGQLDAGTSVELMSMDPKVLAGQFRSLAEFLRSTPGVDFDIYASN